MEISFLQLSILMNNELLLKEVIEDFSRRKDRMITIKINYEDNQRD